MESRDGPVKRMNGNCMKQAIFGPFVQLRTVSAQMATGYPPTWARLIKLLAKGTRLDLPE